jgi:uncharacterized membrane protein (DUF485 family)
LTEPAPFGPYSFALTDDEARIAASRIALHSNLARRFERDYVAPLVVFVLFLVFIAVLAFSGLMNRRLAEAALLVGAIVFLAARFLAHWRLRDAQRVSQTMLARIVALKDIRVTIDDEGLTFDPSVKSEATRRLFHQVTTVEDAGGLIYLWRREHDETPAILPTRIFADADETKRFLVFVRAKIAAR